MLTEQLLVELAKVGTVKWLQIEAIPLLCFGGLALLNVWSSSPCSTDRRIAAMLKPC